LFEPNRAARKKTGLGEENVFGLIQRPEADHVRSMLEGSMEGEAESISGLRETVQRVIMPQTSVYSGNALFIFFFF
jgi:hypothetical protein